MNTDHGDRDKKRITKKISVKKMKRELDRRSQIPNTERRTPPRKIEVSKKAKPDTPPHSGSEGMKKKRSTKKVAVLKKKSPSSARAPSTPSTKVEVAKRGTLDSESLPSPNGSEKSPSLWERESDFAPVPAETPATREVQKVPVLAQDPELAQLLQGQFAVEPLFEGDTSSTVSNGQHELQTVPVSVEDPELVQLLQAPEMTVVSFLEQGYLTQGETPAGEVETVPIAAQEPELVEAIERLKYVAGETPQRAVVPETNISEQETPQISQDIQQYAGQIGVAAEDLHEAMIEEGISSLAELRHAFDQARAGIPGTPDFAMFVHSLVGSYVDRKSEDELLSLIGVSSSTGSQKLDTTYSQLLQEIFRVELGGFFLRDTQNANYNAFNLGNLIQEKLMPLGEAQRVSYLQRLYDLLSDRQNLLQRSKKVVRRFAGQPGIEKDIPYLQEMLPTLEQYLADLALYRLCFRPPDRLPQEISSLVPVDVYQCLEFIWGFPPHLHDADSKAKYMLQRLKDDDPLYFYIGK